nr:uncharacterized protein CI109_005370 [Kwoniella shandongensis]KAA5526246.1 hypothetical protein CI109_005370 [Kwoniella shandongensis]
MNTYANSTDHPSSAIPSQVTASLAPSSSGPRPVERIDSSVWRHHIIGAVANDSSKKAKAKKEADEQTERLQAELEETTRRREEETRRRAVHDAWGRSQRQVIKEIEDERLPKPSRGEWATEGRSSAPSGSLKAAVLHPLHADTQQQSTATTGHIEPPQRSWSGDTVSSDIAWGTSPLLSQQIATIQTSPSTSFSTGGPSSSQLVSPFRRPSDGSFGAQRPIPPVPTTPLRPVHPDFPTAIASGYGGAGMYPTSVPSTQPAFTAPSSSNADPAAGCPGCARPASECPQCAPSLGYPYPAEIIVEEKPECLASEPPHKRGRID